MSKKILIFIIIVFFFIAGYLFLNREKQDFVQCLAEKGMIIYGSQYCAVCTALVDNFGGLDKINLIYVECNQETERCIKEMKTDFVPEIQIKGEVYNGPIILKSIGQAVGCNK